MRLYFAKVIIVLCFVIKFNEASNNNSSLKLKKFSNVSISDVCDSRNKKCIWKCCPAGHHLVRWGACTPSDSTMDLSTIPVYDAQFNVINKPFDSIFQLVPATSKTLPEDYMDFSSFFNLYLKEDGNLYYEIPNKYERWISVEPDKFCVDVLKKRSGALKATIRSDLTQDEEPYGIDTYTLCGMGVTAACMLLTVLPYLLCHKLRDANAFILIVFIVMFVAPMIIILVTLETACDFKTCLILSDAIYFCWICSFCWTNVMFYRLPLSRNHWSRATSVAEWAAYLAYTIIIPKSLTAFMIMMEKKDLSHLPWIITPSILASGFGLSQKESLFYLYIPLSLLLLINWIICFVKLLCRHSPKRFSMEALNIGTEGSHSPLHSPSRYVILLILLSCYVITNGLGIMHPNNGAYHHSKVAFTLVMGPTVFITFVLNKHVLRCRGALLTV